MLAPFSCLAVILMAALTAQTTPNVVVFLSDDQGWGDLGHSGNQDLRTPHIDSLARDGASFAHFFVCPVCSPTRAEFLTGRYHPRSNVYATSRGGERINPDETTIAELFQARGYATGAFGKWHNGMQYPYHPLARGFEEFYGFCSGHWGDYFSPLLEHNGRIVQGEGYCIDDFTNRALTFMEKSHREGRPFFAYLPYNTPHSPMQVPEKYWQRFADKKLTMKPGKAHHRCALAMCENLDFNVGRVLQKLDDLGLTEETIVVWFHDNGPNGHRWNGGMKGIKGSVNEGGCRSPLFIKWPGTIRPGLDIARIASARDLLPTLCELAGVTALPEKPLDGKSLVPLIDNPETRWPERLFINQWRRNFSVRSQSHRLGPRGKLYDMTVDPGQSNPITDREMRSRLERALAQYQKELLPAYGAAHENRPFIIAHPDFPLTQLPARDGTATGLIKRSSVHPNDSYFLDWTRTSDYVSWNALAATSGDFKVTVYHAAESPGAKMTLRFQDAALDFTIPDAHDVPVQGQREDRSPRTESYTKDWKALEVGTISLAKGEGELVLRAREIPGQEALELRLITLALVD